MELKKNTFHTVTVEGMNSEGFGVARIEGRAVFVAGALPGEKCRIKILKVTSTAVYAKVDKLLEPSPHRIEPECPYFNRCGGCDFLHMDYGEELRIKKDRVNDAFARIGGLKLTVSEIIGAPTRKRYRNKAIFAVSRDESIGKNQAITGFFRPRSHQVIPVESCLIQSEAADRAARILRDWMDAYSISHYEEKTGKGLVRNLFVRTAFSTGKTAVCIVAAGDIPKKKELVGMLRSGLPEASSIILNINKSRGNTVLSGSFQTLWGDDFIEDVLCGLTFKLSPLSFYQVNSNQAEILYNKAIEYADLTGNEQVLDLYCGTGTIGLCVASKTAKVVGVETVEDAVKDARANAVRNNILNAEFICSDAGRAAETLLKQGFHPDVVFLDPPRKGLGGDAIEAVAAMSPGRIVYVSCDPATLARDLKLFQSRNYEPQKAVAIDMFPGTTQVECIVLMTNSGCEGEKQSTICCDFSGRNGRY